MKRSIICAVAAAFLCTVGMVGVSFADKGPADIKFETKKPVIFPHAAHQERMKCADCHHSQDDAGKQVAYVDGQKVEKCGSCHNKESGMPKKLASLKGAGHARCKECHKKSGNKTLTKCNTCHVKKPKKTVSH